MSLADLGRRAVACKRWRWMPGMLLQWKTEKGSHYRGRVCDTWSFEDEGALYCEGHEDRFTREELNAARPDLSDPATLGCLLHLVREATGEHSSASWCPGGKHDYPHWAWYSDDCYGKLCEGATEAECLVKVLEAAP